MSDIGEELLGSPNFVTYIQPNARSDGNKTDNSPFLPHSGNTNKRPDRERCRHRDCAKE